jgi:outer membrane protein assembly factor BamB
MRRVRARDNETPDESAEVRYMAYALDAETGKIKWEQEAHRGKPSGGRHRKNTYARNDLGEMSLASPAIADGAIYIRTESKLYKIGG